MHTKYYGIIDLAQRLVKGGTMGKSLSGKDLGKGITQRKDKLYQGSFVDNMGKRHTLYARTVTELRDKMAEAKKKSSVVHIKSPTMDEWFEEWLTMYKMNLRASTAHSYRTAYNRIKPYIGSARLRDIDFAVMQKAMNNLKSDASRKHTKAVLLGAFKTAIKLNYISVNPLQDVNIHVSGDEQLERRVLTIEETEWFKMAIKDRTYEDVYLLALETGMRINELLGLERKHLDFNRNLIFVSQTLSWIGTKWEIHKPKTFAGRRTIPMTTVARDILLKYIEKNGLLFQTCNGRPICYRDVDRAMNVISTTIAKKHPGFMPITPHTLRHTFATRCIEKGMNPKTLQKILGHSTLHMTMDLYCHVTEDTLIEEMKKVEML